MSDRKLTSFAVAGAGYLGLPIIKALASISPQPRIVVLSRSSSKLGDLPDGVESAIIDCDDRESIIHVLKQHQIEAVISTLATTTSTEAQQNLSIGAKHAGVEVLLASDFGFPTDGAQGDNIFVQKAKMVDHLKAIGLPFARVYTGYFIDSIPILIGAHTGKAHIIGRGIAPVSFTAIQDIAGFVAFAFTSLPLSQLQNATFRLEGQRASLVELADILGLPIEYTDHIPADSPHLSALSAFFHEVIELGAGTSRWDWNTRRELSESEVWNELGRNVWPGHVWKQIERVSPVLY